MMNALCLDSDYSTTRLVIQTPPTPEKSPEDAFKTLLFLPEGEERQAEGGLRTKGYFKKSYIDKPLISIVTVVYNGEKFLEEAVVSVINQNYDNIEYIIIDGGSTDKTVEIIKKYENQIDYWVSESDEGQSDAFIKAFSICQGEWFSWLNGDDILLPEAIDELVQAARKYSDVECFTGNVIWTSADNKIIQCRKGERWSDILPRFGILNVYGPTTFFKKSLYEIVEGIDNKLQYMMDTDLWWQFYKVKAKFKRLNKYTWTLRLHKDAKMSGHHFENSFLSDPDHPSVKEKENERILIEKLYYLKQSNFRLIISKSLLWFFRITSNKYLLSLIDSKRFEGMNIFECIKWSNE